MVPYRIMAGGIPKTMRAASIFAQSHSQHRDIILMAVGAAHFSSNRQFFAELLHIIAGRADSSDLIHPSRYLSLHPTPSQPHPLTEVTLFTQTDPVENTQQCSRFHIAHLSGRMRKV